MHIRSFCLVAACLVLEGIAPASCFVHSLTKSSVPSRTRSCPFPEARAGSISQLRQSTTSKEYDVSVPYDAAARQAYQNSDQRDSMDFETFQKQYEAEAIELVKSKRSMNDLSPPLETSVVSSATIPYVPPSVQESPSSAIQSSKTSSTTDDFINDFCQGTNAFWKRLVIPSVQDYVAIRPGGTAQSDILSKLTAPPENPGIPRPVWLVILGSVPTTLGWYGYYKFSIEEELFQHELAEDGKVSGCGGYGTLFPFVYGVLVGFPLSILHFPGGETILNAAAVWILAGQVNLYRRVNELCAEEQEALGLTQPPLHAWWALLPPPLDVVVGLRQVHFLSEYWRVFRQEDKEKDIIAEELFPFISSDRFTLKQFIRQPSRWFWFTKEWKDLDQFEFLKD